MEKFIKWSCFLASGCVVGLFVFALYISTLLPDTFLVNRDGSIQIAGMPFVRAGIPNGVDEVASTTVGAS